MIKLYNSLTRRIEEFEPINPPNVGMYTCGPTVYGHSTIGNWRTYTTSDIVLRTLRYADFDVTYIMNITDVGHLTGDNEGDADTGDDRLEKQAKKERKTAWSIAKEYTKAFYRAYDELNLIKPKKFTLATEYIQEQIDLVQKIEEKGYAYKISDGIYFDIQKYEKEGNKHGQLSDLDKIQEGMRIEPIPSKKDPRDFALWKFSRTDKKRDMEWDSPWGKGFPGWHIECSAMSMEHLGEQFDIHVGGEDLRSTHHPNEITQSESATGKKPFVKYWVHGAFLLVDGGRMGKSLGNAYTASDIKDKGFDPLDLRYFYLTAHYRKQQNFTWDALKSAQSAREKLASYTAQYKEQADASRRTVLSEEKLDKVQIFSKKFRASLEDDLNMPKALATTWEVVKSNIPSEDKYELLIDFDSVLGLNLAQAQSPKSKAQTIPREVQKLVKKREALRKEKKWEEADKIRDEIRKTGYLIEDRGKETVVKASD